jgi:hypothetical protein
MSKRNKKQKAPKKVTQEEIDIIKRDAYQAASKPILTIIADALEEKDCKGIADRVRSLAFEATASAAIPFEYNGETYKVCTALAPVSIDYKHEIMLPPSFTHYNELLSNFDVLKVTAVTYWESFKHEHKELYDEIKEVLGVLDIVEMTNIKTMMRFENAIEAKRIGLFSYIINPQNQVLSNATM